MRWQRSNRDRPGDPLTHAQAFGDAPSMMGFTGSGNECVVVVLVVLLDVGCDGSSSKDTNPARVGQTCNADAIGEKSKDGCDESTVCISGVCQAMSFTITIDGKPLCPLGLEMLPGAVATNGQIYVGKLGPGAPSRPVSCSGGGGNLNQLTFRPIPSPGTSSPCDTLRVIDDSGKHSYCAGDKTAPTGTITVTGKTGSLIVSGSWACAGSPGGTEATSTVEFSNIPLEVR